MGVFVYIDGFNFYYRLYKNANRKYPPPPHHKWLDLLKLSERLMPGKEIAWIGYFTAFVRPNHRDPDQHIRQRAYIEALRTIPCLEVVPGTFQPATKWGIPLRPPGANPAQFDTFEEKGSDVNIAARLVWDAARGAFSEAVLISNDSDLREAVRIAVQEAGRVVHTISPDLTQNNALRAVASSSRTIDTKLFKKCLFPDTLTNADGVVISRPAAWARPG